MKYLRFFVLATLVLACFVSCEGTGEENPPDNHQPVDSTGNGMVQYGTPFSNIPAAEDIIMYEVNLRAFSESGDIEGVISGLDHIESLGVNVIWLMPIHPIGQENSVNSPYSVRDYKAVGNEYGSLDDLRDLTDAAHSRGIAVIMDWVANHTAWDNEWTENDGWHTQDGNGNIIHPPGTNWQDVADLNYENEDMREAMIGAMQYWAYEANIDGFRCDYADGVPFDFWQEAIAAMDTIPGREFIWFAEGARKDHFTAGFDLNFGWQFYGAVKDAFNGQPASIIFNAHNQEYSQLPSGKHWIRFTTNHDESAWDATPIQIFKGEKGALTASVITLFTGGVPLIYGSQEVGVVDNIPFFSNSTIDWDNNPGLLESYREIFRFYSVSDVARKGQNTVYTHNDVACFKKTLDQEEILLVANIRNSTSTFAVPQDLENSVWNAVVKGEAVSLGEEIILQPYEFLILEQ
jgi:glycosidase